MEGNNILYKNVKFKKVKSMERSFRYTHNLYDHFSLN